MARPDDEHPDQAVWCELVDLWVAQDEEKLTKITTAAYVKGKDRELGLAIGYPKTAGEAFKTDEKIFVRDLLILFQ